MPNPQKTKVLDAIDDLQMAIIDCEAIVALIREPLDGGGRVHISSRVLNAALGIVIDRLAVAAASASVLSDASMEGLSRAG